MVNIITINWIIGGVAGILMFYASFITFMAAKKMTGELKKSILLLLGALLFYLFMGFGIGIMAVKDIHYSERVWLIISTFSLIGGILFVVGARKLFKVLLNVSENDKKINKKEVKK
ncbi:hypothetical protein HOD75_03840 [archaeon]|jgi:hypothetical protein|nr:hypothetical protein [archaeon]MBT4242002.1 hypothetical protein [archaeon]MBT4418549.1 hypothetical protein [archaeon]